MKTLTYPEILAPAGSKEQLVAAVNNNCDAVYLGLDSLNARMKAPNFTKENIREWIDYCHFFGVKVYIAINTSIKNVEFAQAVELLNTAYSNNADGVIVTDLALMRLASKLPKPFEVVASTQLNVHDKYGAQFVKQCGATTVVCARESSIDDIKSIIDAGVKAECFIHGATCVCQSGQCLMSSMVGGYSGNRGLCAQPCRKKYSFDNGKTFSYLLSARDLCGLENLQELSKIGVSSLKIEGRNRRYEYAGICSQIYKSATSDSNYSAGKFDKEQLAEMFNRQMGALSYIRGQNDDIIYAISQNHIGVKVGAVKGQGVTAITSLRKGDGLKVFDNNGVEICGGLVLEDGRQNVKCSFSGKVCDGMTVNRTTSVDLCEKVCKAKRLIPIELEFKAQVGSNVKIIARTNEGITAEIITDYIVEKAINNPVSIDEVKQQLQKIRNTNYTITDINIDIGDIFIAKSQINALRRDLLDILTNRIIERYNSRFASRKNVVATSVNTTKAKAAECCCAALCKNLNDLYAAAKNNKIKYIVFKPQFINRQTLDAAKAVECFIDLPPFSDNDYIAKLLSEYNFGIMCHNVGHIQMARNLGLNYIAGSGLNIFNDYMTEEFSDAETFVYSHELTLKEISQFSNQSGLTFIDGSLTLMKFVHCPFKVTTKCSCDKCVANDDLIYLDELNNKFRIIRRRDIKCSFELVNWRKLSGAGKINSSGRYFIDYDEDILAHYLKLNDGIYDDYVESQSYTKGRLWDKVK